MSLSLHTVVLRTFSPLILLTGLFQASRAEATTYKVGPTRQNKTLQSITSQLAPGDIVEVDGDATYSGGVTFTEAGTAAAPITIRGVRVNGKRPVLSGGTNTVAFQSMSSYKSGADHYLFEGFELTGGSSRCLFHQAGDLTVRDVVIHGCPKQGLLGADGGSGSLTLEYSEVYDCGGGLYDHQIYMATDQENRPGSVFRMQHCYVHDAKGGNNVKSRAERNEIYHNWIEGAYYHELELIGCDGCPEQLKREDSDVVGNVLIKRATAANNNPDFSVVRFGGDGTGQSWGRYRFVNNTVISGSGAVFRLFDGLESLEAHNNVFFRQGGAPNLKRTTEAKWASGSEIVVGANNWVKTGATNVPSAWTGTITGSAPGLVDIGNNSLSPAAGSPLINAGIGATVGPSGHPFPKPLPLPLFHPPARQLESVGGATARPKVGIIDIGAFEHGSASPPTDAGGDHGATGDASNTADASSPTELGGDRDTGTSPTTDGNDGRPSDDGCGCVVSGRVFSGRAELILGLVVLFVCWRRRIIHANRNHRVPDRCLG